jgi:hypothetical protein
VDQDVKHLVGNAEARGLDEADDRHGKAGIIVLLEFGQQLPDMDGPVVGERDDG